MATIGEDIGLDELEYECEYTSTPLQFWTVQEHLLELVEDQNRQNQKHFTDELVEAVKRLSDDTLNEKLGSAMWVNVFTSSINLDHEKIVAAKVGFNHAVLRKIRDIMIAINNQISYKLHRARE